MHVAIDRELKHRPRHSMKRRIANHFSYFISRNLIGNW
jgi:hypothetical protein